MNLNDEALSELGNSPIVDNDLVKLPGSQETPKEAISIIAADAENPSNGVVPPELISKLPELDVTLKIINDGKEKVFALKDVQDEILTDNSISKESAQYVNTNFNGLFDGPVKLGEFTESKSKTNFGHVTRHMSRVISKEEVAIAGNIQLLLSIPLEQAKNAFDCLLADCLPTVEQQCSDLQAFTIANVEKIMQSKDVVFPYGENTFINLKTTDFSSFEANKFTSLDSVVKDNLTSLGLVFKDAAFTTFVHCVKDNCSATDAISEDYHPTYAGSIVTGEDLLKFYSVSIDTYLEHIRKVCETQLAYLNSLSKDSNAYIESTETMNAFLAQSLPSIETAFATLRRAMKVINNLSVLNFNAKGYLKFLSCL